MSPCFAFCFREKEIVRIYACTRSPVIAARSSVTVNILLILLTSFAGMAEPWTQRTIDDSSQGADGVQLANANGDGLPDMVTPWEEGGVVRVYFHPGYDLVTERWPSVTVGAVAAPEDAVLVDLDGDGALDVVTSCEGNERTVYVHWAPKETDDYRDGRAWRTEVLPASRGLMQWMYCLPMDVDGDGDTDLVMGAKNEGAQVGFFICPDDPRDLAAWRWQPVHDAGWIMSLEEQDVNRDGVADVLISDRRGPARGILWLDGAGDPERWRVRRIGPVDLAEVMFLWGGRFDDGGPFQVYVGAKEERQLFHLTQQASDDNWTMVSAGSPESLGDPKSVAVADLNLDGTRELVMSCEAGEDALGLVALDLATFEVAWTISETKGGKFDRVELVDLDGDGDQDVLTCEEREGLGVVWFENPRH